MPTANPDPQTLREAGRILREGGLVAFPTETVYGLGGDALNKEAAAAIYRAKGRPSDNPLIVHIAEAADMEAIAADIPDSAWVLAAHFWPGPLTMILKKKELVPSETTGGLPTVAVRCPANRIARDLIREAGGFVAAPSANRSGRPSPTTAQHVEEDLGDRIDLILDGGEASIGLESTIVDLTGKVPEILRLGFYDRTEIGNWIGEVRVADHLQEGERPRAPGMRYRHYAPDAELVLVPGNMEETVAEIRRRAEEDEAAGLSVGILCVEENKEKYPRGLVRCLGSRNDEASIARHLYAALRAFDADGVDRVYSETIDKPGLGEAIMDRLSRAAGEEGRKEWQKS